MANFFQPYGLHINGIIHLSPREAFDLLPAGAVLVDVREAMEMNGKRFAVDQVMTLPFSLLKNDLASLPAATPLIFADSVGMNSKQAVQLAQANGFVDVANLNGGIVDWERDGLPTDIRDEEVLIGQCACKLAPKKAYRPTMGKKE